MSWPLGVRVRVVQTFNLTQMRELDASQKVARFFAPDSHFTARCNVNETNVSVRVCVCVYAAFSLVNYVRQLHIANWHVAATLSIQVQRDWLLLRAMAKATSSSKWQVAWGKGHCGNAAVFVVNSKQMQYVDDIWPSRVCVWALCALHTVLCQLS